MQNVKGKVMITQRENRHILKLTGVEPKLAGMISCDTSGDSTKCNFSVTGKMITPFYVQLERFHVCDVFTWY